MIYRSSRFTEKMLLSNKKVHIFPDFSFTQGYMCVYGHYTPIKETSLAVV